MITKDKLKNFLKNNRDVRFEEIVKELKVSKEDIPQIKKFLIELEKEKYIIKSICADGKFEWDPGVGQD